MRELEAMIESPEAKGEDPGQRVPDSRLPGLRVAGTERAFSVRDRHDTMANDTLKRSPRMPRTTSASAAAACLDLNTESRRVVRWGAILVWFTF